LLSLPAEVSWQVSSQAAEIPFSNAFRLLMWIKLAAMPLILLLRRPLARRAG
jgi:DHA2 family multidrug resistance protein